jgi:(5-formylfuran-3-yl)methyl phosphate synthase
MSARPIRPGPPDPRQTHHVAKLLVSVRSAIEAVAALAGGAAVIDVKEPRHGPLGRAPSAVWREVRAVVPRQVPVSVALGELNEWMAVDAVDVPCGQWSGLTYAKLGLSNAPRDWTERWRDLRQRLAERDSATPAWVAVVYVDWKAARAPAPEAIIEEASAIDACRGVLFDTWDKSQCPGIDLAWTPIFDRVRHAGRFVALAGSLDVAAIGRLTPLKPDIFAVRGAACTGGDRHGSVDRVRVTALVEAIQDRTASFR